MRLLAIIVTVMAVGCANDPQYVQCGSGDGSDVCTLDSQMGSSVGTGDDAVFVVTGSLHVPVMPPDSALQKTTEQLQATLPADVVVPVYRLDMYDLSVEWTLKNLDATPTTAAVALNAANEDFAWDPAVIKPASDEDPPPPSLQGNIPFDVPANGEVSGVFTEDELLEAAIDLDEITRGNINMYAATLVVSKDDQSFQPLSAQQPPPADSDQAPAQSASGDPVPRSAFRQIIRVDMAMLPGDSTTHLTLTFDIRVRPQIANVIDSMGMDAPASQLMIIDPPTFMPAYTP